MRFDLLNPVMQHHIINSLAGHGAGWNGRQSARSRRGEPELWLDHVGSVPGAATVIAALHRGEKRLVFCESRRQVEGLATALRERDVETSLSHSSSGTTERRSRISGGDPRVRCQDGTARRPSR